MTYTFNCPNCGAENTYTGEDNTTHCSFCGSEVTVPAELVNEATTKKLSKRVITWIIVLAVIVFVVPTCIAFGGAILGFFAAIFGAIVSIVAPFLGH